MFGPKLKNSNTLFHFDNVAVTRIINKQSSKKISHYASRPTFGTYPYPVLHIEAEKNGRHFPDDISKCIFFNKNVWIVIKISLKFVPRGPINNIPSLV